MRRQSRSLSFLISVLRLREVTPSLATSLLPLNHMDQMLGLTYLQAMMKLRNFLTLGPEPGSQRWETAVPLLHILPRVPLSSVYISAYFCPYPEGGGPLDVTAMIPAFCQPPTLSPGAPAPLWLCRNNTWGHSNSLRASSRFLSGVGGVCLVSLGVKMRRVYNMSIF